MKTLAKTVKLSLVLIASLSIASVALSAQEFPQRGPIPFSTYDVNKDGVISESEFNDTRAARMSQKSAQRMQNNMNGMQNNMKGMGRNMPAFESFDLNNDGYLSETEMDKFRAKRMEERAAQGKMMRNSGNQTKFSDIDTNNDGKVSKEEFMSNRMKKRAQK